MSRRLVIISPQSGFEGGAIKSMYQLVLNLGRHGYDVTVIVPGLGTLSDQLKIDGICVEVISFGWWIDNVSRDHAFLETERMNSEAFTSLVECLLRLKPLACITYTADMPWLAYASRVCGVPHMTQFCESIDDNSIWQTRLTVDETLSLISELSMALFSNSDFVKNRIKKYITNRDIRVVYPYVNTTEIIRRSKEEVDMSLGTGEGSLLTLVGSIMPAKGQFDAIRALSELKKRGIRSTLYIVGGVSDQRYYKELKAYISQNELNDRVVFTGNVDNPYAYMGRSDLVLVCSVNEPFGRVTAEAIALSKPVIGADSAGTTEILTMSPELGVLYTPGDYASLADKIIMQLNADDVARVRRAARFMKDFMRIDQNHAPILDVLMRLEQENSPVETSDLARTILYSPSTFKEKIVNLESEIRVQSEDLIKVQSELETLRSSKSFRLGRILTLPIRFIKRICRLLVNVKSTKV